MAPTTKINQKTLVAKLLARMIFGMPWLVELLHIPCKDSLKIYEKVVLLISTTLFFSDVFVVLVLFIETIAFESSNSCSTLFISNLV